MDFGVDVGKATVEVVDVERSVITFGREVETHSEGLRSDSTFLYRSIRSPS